MQTNKAYKINYLPVKIKTGWFSSKEEFKFCIVEVSWNYYFTRYGHDIYDNSIYYDYSLIPRFLYELDRKEKIVKYFDKQSDAEKELLNFKLNTYVIDTESII